MADPVRVEVLEGLNEGFFKRHRGGRAQAEEVWTALVRLGGQLSRNPFFGVHILNQLFPKAFRNYENLWKLDLPYGFRAVYTILGRPGRGIRVAIEWIGDHKEYDQLFGYSTS